MKKHLPRYLRKTSNPLSTTPPKMIMRQDTREWMTITTLIIPIVFENKGCFCLEHRIYWFMESWVNIYWPTFHVENWFCFIFKLEMFWFLDILFSSCVSCGLRKSKGRGGLLLSMTLFCLSGRGGNIARVSHCLELGDLPSCATLWHIVAQIYISKSVPYHGTLWHKCTSIKVWQSKWNASVNAAVNEVIGGNWRKLDNWGKWGS